MPGYVEKAAALKAKGVEVIACISVNDPFVMEAWGKAHNADGKASLCNFLDLFGSFLITCDSICAIAVPSVRPYVCLSVCQTSGSYKNG